MTLSVPLPKKTRLFVVHMFWRDEMVTPRRYKLVLPTDANLELLKAALGRKIGLHMNKVVPSNRNELLECCVMIALATRVRGLSQ